MNNNAIFHENEATTVMRNKKKQEYAMVFEA